MLADYGSNPLLISNVDLHRLCFIVLQKEINMRFKLQKKKYSVIDDDNFVFSIPVIIIGMDSSIIDAQLILKPDREIIGNDFNFNWIGKLNDAEIKIPQHSKEQDASEKDFELPGFVLTSKKEILRAIEDYLNHEFN